MSTELLNFRSGSRVWVWDSTWLPAIVVHRAQGRLLVGQARAWSYFQRTPCRSPGAPTPLAEAATSLQQKCVTGSQLDTNKEELKNMNREECREILSLACFDYRYFRRHRRSLLESSKLCTEYREPSQRSNGAES